MVYGIFIPRSLIICDAFLCYRLQQTALTVSYSIHWPPHKRTRSDHDVYELLTFFFFSHMGPLCVHITHTHTKCVKLLCLNNGRDCHRVQRFRECQAGLFGVCPINTIHAFIKTTHFTRFREFSGTFCVCCVVRVHFPKQKTPIHCACFG